MTSPRSLADDLRQRTRSQLADLLMARPDLLSAMPASASALATQAGNRPSVIRALAGLDAAHLMALTAVALAGDRVRPAELTALGSSADELVADLWQLALVWGEPGQVSAVRAARDLILGPEVGPVLGGLYPRVAELAGDPQQLRDLLNGAPPGVVDQLEAVLASPVPRVRATGAAAKPLAWLRDHGVLIPASGNSLVLPVELAAALTGTELGPDHIDWTLSPPQPGRDADEAAVAHSAAAAASAAVDLMGHLLEWLAANQPSVLRSGGLGVREAAKASAELGCDAATTRALLEIAGQLGLIGLGSSGDRDRDEQVYLPHSNADSWAAADPAGRWAAMALAWLRMPRRTQALEGESRAPNVLHADLSSSIAALRRLALSALDGAGAVDPEDFLLLVAWRAPLTFTEDRRVALRTILGEAQFLGVVARDALTGPGRALLGIPEPEPVQSARNPWGMEVPEPTITSISAAAGPAAEAMRALMPEPVSEVIIQADLTMVVPGPATPKLAAFLRDVADVESRGAATVLRISPATLRRAMDRGFSAAKLRRSFTQWSRTQLPQPLGYLISEVERTHGRLRAGSAQSYLRSEDSAALAAIAADQRLSELGLALLAPTVLVSTAERAALVEQLAKAGYSVVSEGLDGKLSRASAPPRARKAIPVRRGPAPWERPPGRALAEQVAANLATTTGTPRAPAAPEPPERIPYLSAAELRALLSAAARIGQPVWVDQTDRYGLGEYRCIWPIQVTAGKVLARTDADRVVTIPLSRIAGAEPV